jgi:hypothetical protein
MKHLPNAEVTGPHQSRPQAWPPELSAFADALESVLAAGKADLPSIAAGLNDLGYPAPGGGTWTETTLRARLGELGS